MFTPFRRLLIAAALGAMAAPVRAQLAVVDAPAVAQLVHEVQAVQQQVQTAEAQLLQAGALRCVLSLDELIPINQPAGGTTIYRKAVRR